MVKEVTLEKTKGGWYLNLDGRQLATPLRKPLLLPSETLAEAVADEWRGGKKFSTNNMPLTAMAFSAIDVVQDHQERMVESMLAFADTDLLLYRSEQAELRARQDNGWNPILTWLQERFDCTVEVTEGVMPVTQPEEMLAAMRQELSSFDAYTMAGFSVLTQTLGSLFLAMSVANNLRTSEEAFALSRIDEDFQTEKWGEDSLALARARNLARDVNAAAKFLALLT